MAKKNGRKEGRKMPLTLEQKITALGPRPTLDAVEPWMDRAGSSAQITWDNQVADLQRQIRERDAAAARIVDPGRVAGKFSPSPYATRGHRVEVAPKKLDKTLPKDSDFPKRVTTQRVVDRLERRGTISHAEHRAAEKLWEWWNLAMTGDRLVAAYEPVTVHTSPNSDRLVAKRMEAAEEYLALMGMVPYRCRGVVTHVVINDWDLSTWGRDRGFSSSHSTRRGGRLLSQGLSALARKLCY